MNIINCFHNKLQTNILWLSLFASFIALVSLQAFATTETIAQNYFGTFGTNDYIEYWSAFQQFREDKNPYDPEALWEIQQSVGQTADKPLMMWTPPWLLTIMSPILAFDFELSSKLWLICNFALILLNAVLLNAALGRSLKRTFIPIVFASIFFYPVWSALLLGQIGILLAFGTTMLLYGLKKNSDFIIALALVFLTLKPHLFYLPIVALGWWILTNKRFNIVLYFCLLLSALLGIEYIQSHHALSYWLEHFYAKQDSQLLVRVVQWRVATLVGFSRSLISQFFGIYPVWPMVVIPGFTAIALWAYLINKKPNIDWITFLPPLLCVSVFTSPYGWIFDQSILYIVQAILLTYAFTSKTTASKRRKILLDIAILQSATFILQSCCITYHHQYFWYPLALIFIWWRHSTIQQENNQRSQTH